MKRKKEITESAMETTPNKINAFIEWVVKAANKIRRKNHTVIHSPFFVDARIMTTPLHHCVPYIVVCTRDYNKRNFNTFELNLN